MATVKTPEQRARAVEFTRQWRKRNAAYCKNHDLVRNYGITLNEYNQRLADQNGCCAMCGVTMIAQRYHPAAINVDHDHVTGLVRNLLCFRCNALLGAAGDSVELLRSAIEYLGKHK